MHDSYVYVIMTLMPLAAIMLTLQVNPYNALVIRGILGAIAALTYAMLGAADVALTEALVGTLLAITLYVVAVRSSLVMRVGVLDDKLTEEDRQQPASQVIAELRNVASQYHLRLELIPYTNLESLKQALLEKEVHATCIESSQVEEGNAHELKQPPYHTITRIRRLYDILESKLSSSTTSLAYTTVPDSGEKH